MLRDAPCANLARITVVVRAKSAQLLPFLSFRIPVGEAGGNAHPVRLVASMTLSSAAGTGTARLGRRAPGERRRPRRRLPPCCSTHPLLFGGRTRRWGKARTLNCHARCPMNAPPRPAPDAPRTETTGSQRAETWDKTPTTPAAWRPPSVAGFDLAVRAGSSYHDSSEAAASPCESSVSDAVRPSP